MEPQNISLGKDVETHLLELEEETAGQAEDQEVRAVREESPEAFALTEYHSDGGSHVQEARAHPSADGEDPQGLQPSVLLESSTTTTST